MTQNILSRPGNAFPAMLRNWWSSRRAEKKISSSVVTMLFCTREGVGLSQLKGSVLQQLKFCMDGPENGFIEQEADVIVYFDEK